MAVFSFFSRKREMSSKIVIVDSHHKVLPAWAEYRSSLSHPPRLITLDHHTDTSPPFRNYARGLPDNPDLELIQRSRLNQMDFSNPRSIYEALGYLNNDEHILTALAVDIIDAAAIIAHRARDTDYEIFKAHRILCRTVCAAATVGREACDQVLESHFLKDKLDGFEADLKEWRQPPLLSKPYILDIDLDYFNTRAAIEPRDATIFRRLVEGAGLITIATEPEYVEHCRLDVELDSDFLLSAIKKMIFE